MHHSFALVIRAPCPALNTLANHGFLPHDGRNITLDKVTSAFGDGLNIDATLAATLFAAAPATNPLPNATWFDLDMLQPHDVIEHDASMSRADVYFNPSNLFDADTFDSFLSFFGANATFLSVNATAAARTRHAYAMSQINPEFNVTETNLPIMMGETALSILMWDDTPGAERDLFEYFFTTITRRQHSSNANPFKCPHCTQAFKSEKRLKMHVEPTHYSPTRLTCPLCASTAGFERPWKLAQHMRDKHAARAAALEAVYSPLDRFFRAHESDNSRDHMRLVYVDADLPDHLWVKCWDVVEGDIYNDKRVLAMPKHFHYEPLLPPWVSFALLRKARRWADGWESMKKAHADYGAALVGELRLAFGNHVGELESWRKLCKAVGVPQKRLPADVDRCRELLHGKHINLVDLASWARWRGDEVQGKTVAAFESASALHRIYPWKTS
ncbi:putative deoxyribonucleaserelated protein [Diplodia seriata]|uniref:Putative deoxyribonucleaserelated protein n=1 Tax=Diplodia seriata TaxID=420778 RepID=A0A0G2E842_9PEZI|nr:putative deoxyribonucleaserelated protein [Diplodia seriata]